MLGWCDARAGQQKLAVGGDAHRQRRDPDNWHYAYGLAVVAGAGGRRTRARPRRRRCGSTRSSRCAIALARAAALRQPGAPARAAGRGSPIPFGS